VKPLSTQVLFHENDVKRLLDAIDVGQIIKEGARVAIKLHMGEEGNATYLKPKMVEKVINVVKALGADPFLVDSPTLYPKKRKTASGYLEIAKAHGFGDLEVEVIIGGGEWGKESTNVALDRYFEMSGVGIVPEIASADAMITLTHVKGHISAKYAGTLKQMGMGCVSTQTKREVHEPTRPKLNVDDCNGCGACVPSCPFGQVSVNGVVSIDEDCVGCGRCVDACPHGAIQRKEKYLERFYKRLMDASRGVLKPFEDWDHPKVVYLNFLMDIYEFCDCSLDPGKRLAPDIGILASVGYPIPIEMASIDLVRKFDPSLFSEVIRYVRLGREIGLGDSAYELKKP
jgi:hypothetical protein